ncbi:MAG: outer membrane beta-barrel protein [Bacteroidetes bacterium]|nr:outer membrane beta-barrel protein [Bacteroidota bacterium]
MKWKNNNYYKKKMRKNLITLLLIALSFAPLNKAFSQESTDSKVFVNLGTSFGYFRTNSDYKNASFPIEGSFDYLISKKASLGFSYAHQQKEFSFIDNRNYFEGKGFDYRNVYNSLALRGTLNISEVFSFNNSQNLQIYLTYLGGAIFKTQTPINYTSDDIIDYSHYRSEEDIRYFLGAATGLRYFVLNNIGIYTEIGYTEFSHIKTGLSIRF